LWLNHSSRIRAYLFAACLVVGAVASEIFVTRRMADLVAVPFLLPVILAAWFGGFGPGLVALALAVIAESLLLFPLVWPPGHELAHHIRMWVLVAEGVIICVLGKQLHEERERSWRVAERLAELRQAQKRTESPRSRAPEVDPCEEI